MLRIKTLSIFLLLTIAFSTANAQMKYEVWAGNTNYGEYSESHNYHYNINSYDYTYLGESSDGSTKTFYGQYNYYVITTKQKAQVVDGFKYKNTTITNFGQLATGNLQDYSNLYAIDGNYATMSATGGGYYSSFITITNTGSWDELTVVTYSEDDTTNDTADPYTDVELTETIELDGEYWFYEMNYYRNYLYYDSLFGESIIDNGYIDLNVFNNTSESKQLEIETAGKDSDGWIYIKSYDENTSKYIGNSNLIQSVSLINDSSDITSTTLQVRKSENPTEDDLIGEYKAYGYWIWYEGYSYFESEASIGTLNVKSGKLNASFEYTEIDSGSEKESETNIPWSLDSSTPAILIDTEEDDVTLYICDGGILFDPSNDEDEAGFHLFVKNGKNKKISDMEGTWLVQEYATDEYSTGSAYTSRGMLTVDSKGNYLIESTFCDGYSTEDYQDTGKFSISSNGNFNSKSNSNSDKTEGTLNVDSNIFVYSIFDRDDIIGIGIGVKVEDDNTTDPGVDDENLAISLELGSCKYPTSAFTNTSTAIQLGLKVGNSSSETFPDDAEVEVLVYADNGQQDSEPVLLDTIIMNVGKLKPGKAKSLKANLETPADLAAGEYIFSATCNDTAVTTESNGTMTIADGFTGFDIAIASVKVPDAVIAGTSVKGTVQAEITNVGNMTTDKELTSEVKVIAREINSEAEYTVGQVDLSSGNMKPGKSKKANIKIDVPANTTEGTYELIVVASTPVVGDAASSTVEQSTGKQLAISEPFIDLTASIAQIKAATVILPGASAKMKVPVEINNIGNTPTNKTQEIDVELYLRPTEGGDDIFAGRIENFNIGNLVSGKAKKLNANLDVPSTISGGNYEIVVIVDASGDINETDETNNETIYEQSLSFAGSFMEIAGLNGSNGLEYAGYCKGYLYGYDFNNTNYNIYVDTNDGYVNETLVTDQQDEYEEAIQYYDWEEGTSGTYLKGFGQEIEMGTIDIDFDDLLVFDGTGKGSTSSLTGTVELYLGYGYGDYSIDLYGTASAKGSIAGVKSIEFNGEKQDAIMVTFDMTIDSSGYFEGYTMNLDVSQKVIYYIIPDIGIVKSITKTTAKAGIPGYGSESGTATETRELVYWSTDE